MRVKLLIHLEAGSWWAESPDVRGLSVAAPDLPELRARAQIAVRAVLKETGRDIDQLEIDEVLVVDPIPASEGPSDIPMVRLDQDLGATGSDLSARIAATSGVA